MSKQFQIVYGDIHNHNAHGYGQGSIERSVEIARTHLDFFAFTGHSSWHDLGRIADGREAHFEEGFKRLAETWPRVQNVIADSNEDNEFCSFLGFEWHSNHYGDQCVVFPEDFEPICYAKSVDELRQFCISKSALMIPHHLAYPRGRRGVNWDVFDDTCTPVVEIYSMHGNSEDDRGPFPMFKGSPGGRETSNTVQAAIRNGLRFGFVGSSDNHLGFPGAYGEGLMGALVPELTRPAILDAIRRRRTYALTGDRIEIDFTVEGEPMGSVIDAGGSIEVAYSVKGRDEIEMVEVVQNGTVVHRSFASENGTSAETFSRPFQVRLEWGWGPWLSLGLVRITDWHFDLHIENGEIRRVFPCLSSGPFDEERRHSFVQKGAQDLSVRSYTSRKQAYRENPNQSVVLEIDGGAETSFRLTMHDPAEQATEVTATELFTGSRINHVGPYPAESHLWHRILPADATEVTDRCVLPTPEAGAVYLRIKQKNGHMAWTSPVFVDSR